MLLLGWLRRLLLAVVLLGLLVVGGTAGSIWWTARDDARPVSDAIVVLGASQFDGRPSSVLEARLEHAKRLYEAGVAPRVVTVGGGRPGDRFTEAQAGQAYLQERGVDEVVAVGTGANTLQSLEAAAEVFAEQGWTSAVLVTDPWHSLRSRSMAREQGLEAVTSPTRAGPSVRTRGTQVRYILRETAAFLYWKAFGRSSEGGPSAV